MKRELLFILVLVIAGWLIGFVPTWGLLLYFFVMSIVAFQSNKTVDNSVSTTTNYNQTSSTPPPTSHKHNSALSEDISGFTPQYMHQPNTIYDKYVLFDKPNGLPLQDYYFNGQKVTYDALKGRATHIGNMPIEYDWLTNKPVRVGNQDIVYSLNGELTIGDHSITGLHNSLSGVPQGINKIGNVYDFGANSNVPRPIDMSKFR
jgi:hypothetical protein